MQGQCEGFQGVPPLVVLDQCPHLKRSGCFLRKVRHRRVDLCLWRGQDDLRRDANMNFEKYTERARGFVQAAQNLAMREGHPQLQPGHLLKVLLDDPEGLCAGLIDRAGGQSRVALAQTESWLAKQPKVSGNASPPQATRELVRLFDTAEKAAEKAGDAYVTVERLLLALAVE